MSIVLPTTITTAAAIVVDNSDTLRYAIAPSTKIIAMIQSRVVTVLLLKAIYVGKNSLFIVDLIHKKDCGQTCVT
jgi:hypothetical protein